MGEPKSANIVIPEIGVGFYWQKYFYLVVKIFVQLTQVLYKPVVPGHVREGEGGLFVSSFVEVTPDTDL